MLKHSTVAAPPPGQLGQQPTCLVAPQAGQPPLQPSQALYYGNFVNVAYNAYATNELNPPAAFYENQLPTGFKVIVNVQMTAFGNVEYFGFLALNVQTNQAVLAYRGSQSWEDWIDDMDWELVPFSSALGAGNVASGFLNIYHTLTVSAPDSTEAPVAWADKTRVPGLDDLGSLSSAIFVGHSLGSALITLQAAQVAGMGKVNPTVYTFASPRVGDTTFANDYDTSVSVNYRIYNWPDLVPRFPKDPLDNYQHVKGGYEVDSLDYWEYVLPTLDCFHSLYTYLFLVGAPASSLGGCAT